MKALQMILDGDYAEARAQFVKVLEISEFLQKKKGFRINPQLISSVQAGIKFCDLMQLRPSKDNKEALRSACLKVNEQVMFLKSGGNMLEYDSKKIRSELHGFFASALDGISRKMNC